MTISNNPPATRTYEGIEIEFDAATFKFFIRENLDKDLNGWPRDAHYNSYAEAIEGIKDWKTRVATAEKKALQTRVPMQLPDGTHIIVKGLNRRNGEVQADGLATKFSRKLHSFKGEFYPRNAFIQPLLEEKSRLSALVRDIENILYKVRVQPMTYHRGIDAAYYERVLTQFVDKMEKAQEAADAYEAALEKKAAAETAEEVA